MRAIRSFPIDAAVVVLLFLFFGLAGAIPGIAPNQADEMTGATGSALQTAVGLGSQAIVDMLMFTWMIRSRSTWRSIGLRLDRWQLLLPVALGAWAVLSIAWSHDLPLTLRRAAPFCTETLFGVFLALRYPAGALLRLLLAAFVLLAIWSAALAIGFPSIGLDASTGHGGDWQGVFTQKNACGRAMVFALGATLCAQVAAPARVAMLLLFAAELVLSGSRGAWLLGAILLCALAAVFVATRLERRLRAGWFAGILAGAVVLGVAGYTRFAELAPVMGRDATLSGRIPIWHQVWLAIASHPWLGYGFAGFWHGFEPPSWDVVAALGFVLFHAHNGFLEIWLELGVAGLALFAAGFARAAWVVWPELLAGAAREAAWPFAVLLLALLYDLDENTLLSFNGLFWLLYVNAVTQVELLARERRRVECLLVAHPLRSPWLHARGAEPGLVQACRATQQAGSSAWL